MPERWEHELDKLREVRPPSGLRERVEGGPRSDGSPALPGRRQRLVAAVVALTVFVAAGVLVVRAFGGNERDGTIVGSGTPTASPSVVGDVIVIDAAVDPADPTGAAITASIGGLDLLGVPGDRHTVIDGQDGTGVDVEPPEFNSQEFTPVLQGTPLALEGNATAVTGRVSGGIGTDVRVRPQPFDIEAGAMSAVSRPGSIVLEIRAVWDLPGFFAMRSLFVPIRVIAAEVVPDLIALRDQAAFFQLYELGLTGIARYREVQGERWHVISQSPPPGAAVTRDTVVDLLIATEITPLPEGAADALDCPSDDREPFGGPKLRITPGGSAYIVGNIGGVELSDDVVQVTFGDREWDGVWHVIRDGRVIAVVDFDSLDGVACAGSGVAGA